MTRWGFVVALFATFSWGSAAIAQDEGDRVEETEGSDDAAGEETAPPLEESDEASAPAPAPPPPGATAPADSEPPPVARVKPRAPAPPPAADGLGGVSTGLLGLGAGTGIGVGVGSLFLVFSVVNLVTGGLLAPIALPVSCVGCLWTCLVHPAVVGVVVAWLGDLFGNMRGALAWSLGGAFAGCTVGLLVQIVAGTIIGIVLAGAIIGSVLSGDPNAVNAVAALSSSPVFLVVNGALMVVHSMLVAGGATAGYLLFSEEKQPGDTGGFPGLFSPDHPKGAPASTVERLLAPRAESVAMAF